MNALTHAALWVWDFVIGDAILMAGVVVAIVVVILLAGAGRLSAEWAGAVLFAVIVVSLAVSLWRAVQAA